MYGMVSCGQIVQLYLKWYLQKNTHKHTKTQTFVIIIIEKLGAESPKAVSSYTREKSPAPVSIQANLE